MKLQLKTFAILTFILPVLAWAQGSGTSGGGMMEPRSAECANQQFEGLNSGNFDEAWGGLILNCQFADGEARCLIRQEAFDLRITNSAIEKCNGVVSENLE